MKIKPHEKEKLLSLVTSDIEIIFAKPNKLGYTYESNTGGFEMKKVKESSTKPPVWFVEFEKRQDERWKQQDERWKQQDETNKRLELLITKVIDRLDNIVQKNNLIE